jgi:hypothetical protein
MEKSIEEMRKQLHDAIIERDGGICNANAAELLELGKGMDLPIGEPEKTRIAGSVGISIHVNLGSYNNFDLRVEGVNGDHARALLAQEADLLNPIIRDIIGSAMKFAASHRY